MPQETRCSLSSREKGARYSAPPLAVQMVQMDYEQAVTAVVVPTVIVPPGPVTFAR